MVVFWLEMPHTRAKLCSDLVSGVYSCDTDIKQRSHVDVGDCPWCFPPAYTDLSLTNSVLANVLRDFSPCAHSDPLCLLSIDLEVGSPV